MRAVPIVFVSYSHKDEPWRARLLPHLRALETAGVALEVWDDRRIDAGDKWYPEILDAMTRAAAAVLLVSADYLASAFCIKEEVPEPSGGRRRTNCWWCRCWCGSARGRPTAG